MALILVGKMGSFFTRKKKRTVRWRIERDPKLRSCEIMKCSGTGNGRLCITDYLYIESMAPARSL
jgi:hypothetical protein